MTEDPVWPDEEPGEPGFFFQAEDTDFDPRAAESLSRWLESVVRSEDRQPGEVSFVFCSDPFLHEMNVAYLDHDTLTDVITFPYRDDRVEGDIFISVDRVRENATDLGVRFEDELHRVMVHGVLHLIGYTDTTPEEKAAMRQKEDVYLATR